MEKNIESLAVDILGAREAMKEQIQLEQDSDLTTRATAPRGEHTGSPPSPTRMKTLKFRCGGAFTLLIKTNTVDLSKEDLNYVCGLVDLIRTYPGIEE